MIIKEGTVLIEEGDEFGKVLTAGFNTDLSKIFSMFSTIYKNPIESIIREYTSNLFDANYESGCTNPVIVKFDEDSGGNYISFIDEGLGLTPERMEKVFMNYGTSTKEADSQAIGMYGIGSKSALSYVDSFHIITSAEGTKYYYIYSKGSKGIPKCECLTTEESFTSGTEIKIYIKNNNDVHKFKQACTKQLAYFDNVYVEGNSYFKNDYSIIEGKYFKVNLHHKFNQLHIAFGKVYYPIDWENLGIDSINYPVAVKFDIGELRPIPSREDIEYTQETIALLKERIQLVKVELLELYEKQIVYTEDISQWVKQSSPVLKLEDDKENQLFIYLSKVPKQVQLKGLEDYHIPLENIYKGALDKYFVFSNELISGKSTTKKNLPSVSSVLFGNGVYRYGQHKVFRKNVDRLELNKNRYISSVDNILILDVVNFKSKIELMKNIRKDLILANLTKDSRKYFYKTLKDLVLKNIKSKCQSYKDVVIPQEFLDSLKVKKELDKTQFTVNDGGYYDTTSYHEISKVKQVVYMPSGTSNQNLNSFSRIFNNLDTWGNVRKKRKKVSNSLKVYAVAKPIYEKLSKMENCLTEEQFKTKYQRLIDKAVTCQYIKKFLEENALIIDNIGEKIPILTSYLKELTSYNEGKNKEYFDIDYSGEVISYYQEIIKRCQSYFDKVKILKYVENGEDEDIIEFLREKKVRMNNECYTQLKIKLYGSEEEKNR
jgi:anti-sigma regulatory factor (Ser/Thr protein kinase)